MEPAPGRIIPRWSEGTNGSAFLAIGAAAVLALQTVIRGSLVTMFGKHDPSTRRGKIFGHKFGKHRLRKNARRRWKKIRAGTFDPDAVRQQGQPEPINVYDWPIIRQNALYSRHVKPLVLEAEKDIWDDMMEFKRENWEKFMGKSGSQWWYAGWAPPGSDVEPTEEPIVFTGTQPVPVPQPGPQPKVKYVLQEGYSASVPVFQDEAPPETQWQHVIVEAEEELATPVFLAEEEPPAEEPPAELDAEVPEEEASPVVPPAEPEPPAPEAKEPEQPKADEPPKEDDKPSGAGGGDVPESPPPEPPAEPEPLAPEAKEPEQPKAEEPPKEDDEPPEPPAEPEPPAPEAKEPEKPKAEEPPEEDDEPPAPGGDDGPGGPPPEPKGPPPPLPEGGAAVESAPAPPAAEAPASPELPAGSATEAAVAEPKAPEPQSGGEPEAKAATGKISITAVKELRERSRAAILDCKKALKESDGDMEKAMAWLRKRGAAKADKKAGNAAVEGNVACYVHFNSKLAVMVEVNSETDFVANNAIFKEFAEDVAMQIAALPAVKCISVEEVPEEVKNKEKELEMAKEDLAGKPDNIKEKIVAGRLTKKFEEMALMGQKWLKDDEKTVQEVLTDRIAKLGENIIIRRFVRLNLGEGLEKKDADFAAGVEKELAKYKASPEEAAAAESAEAAEKPKEEEPPKAEEKPKEEPKEKDGPKITAAQVKELRQRSGAGILDSKKALKESGGDIDKAMAWLKKKGMAKAEKKAGNLSVEGAIASYVHFNSKLGVIVEVNSETDFVAINAIFKEFASDVAMQIAANPAVESISMDDVPHDVLAKEKEIELSREDLAGKPDAVKDKIVTGRLKKKFDEMTLLSQKWLKDEDKTVQEVLKETIAKLGENIVIRRFERLTLGEGLEKKQDDFAAGVEKELAKYKS